VCVGRTTCGGWAAFASQDVERCSSSGIELQEATICSNAVAPLRSSRRGVRAPATERERLYVAGEATGLPFSTM